MGASTVEIWARIKDEPSAPVETTPPAPLATCLEHGAALFPERRHVTFGGLAFSYAESWRLAERLAAGLQAQGIGKGDRVGLLLPNHPAYVFAVFALWRIGAVGVGMNPLYGLPLLSGLAADAGLRMLVTTDAPEALEKARTVAGPQAPILAVRADGQDFRAAAMGAPAGATDRPPAGADLTAAAVLGVDGGVTPVAIDPGRDLAMLQYTGGTTGAPKGVMLTHANLGLTSLQLRSGFPKMRPGREAALIAMPFSHIAALSVGLLYTTAMGGELVVMDRFNASEALRLIRERRISYLPISPTVVIALTRAPEAAAADWSSVKFVFSGAAPLPAGVRRDFRALSGVPVRPIYGMTEASPNVVMAAEDDAGESGAVGVAFPGTRLSIRATDEPTRTLATGETGEVCIAGPQIMAGYWNRPEETRRAFVDGYFRSGDLGFLDEAGALHLVGRLKDTINASGYKVHPDAVEEAVRQHEAVAEALVIGAPDAYRGETVKAYVVLKPGRSLTLAELQQFLAGRLSPMETPKQLEVRSELPLTPVGKPSRLALRQEVAAALAAEARSDDGLAAPADPTR